MKINGAELTIRLLEKQGIRIISGIPGGTNLPLYDALSKSTIRHILARHEQGAGFIAQGLSRSTGKPAVCFATSGPGATNLVTAIADAQMDSIPIIAITGQIPSQLIGTDAFQEVDIYGITIPITKHNFLIKKVEELIDVIPEAFSISVSGRPGPVLIDIPKDIQTAEIEISENFFEKIEKTVTAKTLALNTDFTAAASMINNAAKPLIIAGGGIIKSNTSDLLNELSVKNSIPVALTLMGLGSYSPDSNLYLGMPGMHGSRHTNYILQEADLIIALGIRFDDRLTGKSDSFCKNAKIIHIDIDKSELNKIKTSDLFIEGNLNESLQHLLEYIEQNERKEWIKHIENIKHEYPELTAKDQFSPYNIISIINNLTDSNAIITTDVGQHQMWTAQYYKFRKPGTLLTSGGLGTMGFGLPAAIGASLGKPDCQILCITGDGSFLMNIQELALLKELNLNVKVILFKNNSLGLVRQQQELFYDKNYFASRFEFNPEFHKIASAFGIESFNLAESDDIIHDLKYFLNLKTPAFIEIPIAQSQNVFPIVPPGKSNYEMIGGGYHEKSCS
ncbi:MAG: biosynthetic-type acetolactate synthase large subunit [Spirochaetes bacterium]|nr:biosynthetic-type acetolactate synthase large subunit [Spirochaetota bacterium]